MPLGHTDADTLQLVTAVVDSSVADLRARLPQLDAGHASIRAALTRRIMTAVELGQRDPERLRSVACDLIESVEAA
jgi:hypothetical protein